MKNTRPKPIPRLPAIVAFLSLAILAPSVCPNEDPAQRDTTATATTTATTSATAAATTTAAPSTSLAFAPAPDEPAPPATAATPGAQKPEIVELPRYTVTGERILPPPEFWHHTTLPGFEILSNAYGFTTRAFLKDFQQLQSAIAIVWPTLIANKANTPTIIIICARGNSFSQFVPDAADSDIFITRNSLFVEDKERGAIVIDFTMQEALSDSMNVFDSIESAATPITTDDEDPFATETDGAAGVTATTTLTTRDPYAEFYRQYARFLMRRANGNKPIPSWLEEGLAQLFNTLDFSKKYIAFGKVEYGFGENDAAPLGIDQKYGSTTDGAPRQMTMADVARGGEPAGTSITRRQKFGYIMPLEEMFEPDTTKKTYNSTQWKKQCFAFAHMCLYGMNKKYQKPFLEFARKACAGPVTEDDFKKCFGQTYRQMATRMATHVDSLAQESVLFKAKRGMPGLPDPQPVELRDATQAEIGRIKGEVLRLAGHNEESRAALIVPYLRHERDAGLLASLGLLENIEGRKDRARRFLEAAAKDKVVRPRAYATLARLRLDEALAAPAAPDGRLDVHQTAHVLEPLFTALSQPPPMEEVYSLIGDTWLDSSVAPKDSNLGVMLEGAALFPRSSAVIYRAAALYARHGPAETAGTLIRVGLGISPDQPTREKFEALQAAQPASR